MNDVVPGGETVELKKLTYDFTVCQIKDISQVNLSDEFVFLSKTDDEISLVCKSSCVPSNVLAAEDGWKALKISGVLDFGMIGVIANIARILAQADISVFVISTYNTDYILMKAKNFECGIQVLAQNDYVIV